MNKNYIVISVILVALISSSLIGTISARPFYKNISVEKAQKLVTSNGHLDLVILDVRPDFMFLAGHIPGAINVPISMLAVWMAEEGQNHLNNKVIVYCHLGVISPDVAQILAEVGFKKVNNMDGGFMAWSSAGYPVES